MALGGVSSNGLNFTGLATGIDTAKVIDGLNAVSQQRINRFKTQKSEIVGKQTTFAALQGKLFDLQAKTNALARSGGGAFDGRTATASDTAAVTAVAGTAAVAGTYTLTVESLAKAAQFSSAGYADPNARIQEGTIAFQVGGGVTTTVTVDSRNNTLQGLADAVNAANGDLRASVVNDGTTTAPYRLLLTSAKTGSANSIAVTNNLTTGTGASVLETGAITTVQAATDAKVKVGSGAGALTITSETNQFSNLIAGVSLTVLQADVNKSITVSVKNDNDATVKAVQDFVTAYNGVRDFITEQTRFDTDTKFAGALLGNRDASALANELASALSATVPGLSATANRLSSVGLAFDERGKLSFDSSKFSAALNSPGNAAANFKRLFALSGKSDTNGVEFLIGSNKTKPTSSPYTVNITSAASRAVVVSAGPAGPVTLTPPDNALQIKLNGLISSGVTLPGGAYTRDELVAALQKAINSAPSLGGNLVSAVVNGNGKIELTTQKYGSGASVAITGGSAPLLAALGFNGTETGTGSDVAGNFVANGMTETATGSGQILSGASGNANTVGLQVTSTLSAPGSANLTVTQGLASRLGAVLNKYLDPVNGRFKAINDAFTERSSAIDKTVAKQSALLESKMAELQTRFAAMETAVNNLKGLQTQLSSLVIINNSK